MSAPFKARSSDPVTAEFEGDLAAYIGQLGRTAREASTEMAAASGQAKDDALLRIAQMVRTRRDALKAANALDVDRARGNGLEPAMVDRLTLNDKAIAQMADGLEQVAQLADPVGEIVDRS